MGKLSLNGWILPFVPVNVGEKVFIPSLGVKIFLGVQSREGFVSTTQCLAQFALGVAGFCPVTNDGFLPD